MVGYVVSARDYALGLYHDYSAQDMADAYAAVVNRNVPVFQAARQHKVPRLALQDRLKRRGWSKRMSNESLTSLELHNIRKKQVEKEKEEKEKENEADGRSSDEDSEDADNDENADLDDVGSDDDRPSGYATARGEAQEDMEDAWTVSRDRYGTEVWQLGKQSKRKRLGEGETETPDKRTKNTDNSSGDDTGNPINLNFTPTTTTTAATAATTTGPEPMPTGPLRFNDPRLPVLDQEAFMDESSTGPARATILPSYLTQLVRDDLLRAAIELCDKEGHTDQVIKMMDRVEEMDQEKAAAAKAAKEAAVEQAAEEVAKIARISAKDVKAAAKEARAAAKIVRDAEKAAKAAAREAKAKEKGPGTPKPTTAKTSANAEATGYRGQTGAPINITPIRPTIPAISISALREKISTELSPLIVEISQPEELSVGRLGMLIKRIPALRAVDLKLRIMQYSLPIIKKIVEGDESGNLDDLIWSSAERSALPGNENVEDAGYAYYSDESY